MFFNGKHNNLQYCYGNLCYYMGYIETEINPPSALARSIRELFYKKNNFPNSEGNVKNIRLISPQLSGSTYYNYKNHNSIKLMAVFAADYRLIAVDIGSYGR